jgi:L-asparagine transporter-like permease
VYALLCVAVVMGRKNGTTDRGHYRMPWFPIPAVLALLMLVYIVYQNLLDKDFGRPSLMATGLIMLTAAVYYLVMLARRKDWSLNGPDELGN